MEGLVKWVRVTDVWASKRRFSLHFAIDEFVTALENEVDHRGRRRFLLFTDSEGIQWVSAPKRN